MWRFSAWGQERQHRSESAPEGQAGRAFGHGNAAVALLLRRPTFGDGLTNRRDDELGTVGNELFAVFDGFVWRGHVKAIDAVQSNRKALGGADGLRVNRRHDRFVMIVVMHPCPRGRTHVGLLMHANGFEIVIAPHILGVILWDEMYRSCCPTPLLVQALRYCLHPSLVLTVVTEQDNVCEAMLPETTTDIGKQRLEGGFPHTDRPRVLHVARWWRNGALGDELDNRRHQRIAELARDGLGHRLEHVVVFPNGHIRTVGLEPTGTDDHGGFSSPYGVAHFHPGEFFEKDAVDAGNRLRRLEILRATAEGETATGEHDKQPNEHPDMGHDGFSSHIAEIYGHIKPA